MTFIKTSNRRKVRCTLVFNRFKILFNKEDLECARSTILHPARNENIKKGDEHNEYRAYTYLPICILKAKAKKRIFMCVCVCV